MNETTAPTTTPILLTERHIRQHLDILKDKFTYWVRKKGDEELSYAKEPWGSGMTRKLEEAARMKIATALERPDRDVLFALVDQTEAARLAAIPLKRCIVSDVLPSTLLELLKIAPGNPTGRAHVLALAKKGLPDDCSSWDKIKDWVECNCEPVASTQSRAARAPNNGPTPREAFCVEVSFSDTESGRADYSCERYGSDSWEIEAESISEFINDGLTFDEMVDSISHTIMEDAWDLEPEMESSNFNHDNYDQENAEDREVTFSRGTLRNLLAEHLRRTCTPEQLTQIGL